MIKIISWLRFQQLYMKDRTIYALENVDQWLLDVAEPPFIVRTIIPKSEDDSQNFAFVDRHLNQPNIVKVEYELQREPVKLRLVQE